MRQLYIRKSKVCNQVVQVARLQQRNCAKHPIQRCFLLHNAEFLFSVKILILIGKVFSYLTIILPDMGNRAGGECD